MQWAPVPIRSDTIAYSHGALALPRLRYGGPPRCTPNPCARRRGVQPLRWRIAFGFLTELRPCPPGAAPPGAPVRLHPPMLLKPLLMMRPPPPRQVPVGLLAAFWLTRGPPLGARRGSGQHQLLALRSSTARRSRGSCAYRARSLASRPQGNRLVGAGSPTPRGLCACRPADPRCCSRPHCRNPPLLTARAYLPDIVARIHEAGHAGWAVRQLREPDGYLLAPVQEVLLECFGGHALGGGAR